MTRSYDSLMILLEVTVSVPWFAMTWSAIALMVLMLGKDVI